jgi:hypothetical protein
MDQETQLSTSDFTLAAILLVNGFRRCGAEPDSRDPERRKRFVFAGNSNEFARLSHDVVLNDVLVPARAFALAQRRLKRLLYDERPAPTAGSDTRSRRRT